MTGSTTRSGIGGCERVSREGGREGTNIMAYGIERAAKHGKGLIEGRELVCMFIVVKVNG